MSERRRVEAEPAYVLHSTAFRETSLVIEVFSRHHGRIPLVARGARRPRSALRGLMMSFQPLELGWAGKGEVPTLMKAEWVGGQPLLAGGALMCGYYLNELLLHLLAREDAHERIFDFYADTLRSFSSGVSEARLRSFEKILLQDLGYGVLLERDVWGDIIHPGLSYTYEIERGPVPDRCGHYRGQSLIDLARGQLDNDISLMQAKQLMRSLISHHLGGRPLETRRVLMDRLVP